jgi:hypothetical protein
MAKKSTARQMPLPAKPQWKRWRVLAKGQSESPDVEPQRIFASFDEEEAAVNHAGSLHDAMPTYATYVRDGDAGTLTLIRRAA